MSKIRCPLNETACISGTKPGIVGPDGVLLYSEIEQSVCATVALLRRAGCREGERVAVLLGLVWEYPVLVMALVRLGAVVCPLDSRTTPAESRQALKNNGCHRLILSGSSDGDLGIQGIAVLEAGNLVGFTAIVKDKYRPSIEFERPATIFTSRDAERRCRGIMHSFGSHYYNAKGANANMRLSSDSRWLLTMPFAEMEGMAALFRCILAGAAIVLPGADEDVKEAIARYEVTHLSFSPEQFRLFLEGDTDAKQFPRIQAILISGEMPETETLRENSARGFQVHSSYSLPEMASQVTATSIASSPEQRLTSGRALPHREVALADDGEILVKGPTLFEGYVEGEHIVRPYSEDGWFATGSVGRMDADGFLTVIGRKEKE